MTIFILAFFVCALITTIIIVKSKKQDITTSELETPKPVDIAIEEVFEPTFIAEELTPIVLEKQPIKETVIAQAVEPSEIKKPSIKVKTKAASKKVLK